MHRERHILPPRPARIAGAMAVGVAIAVLVVAVLWAILGAALDAPTGPSVGIDIWHLLRMTVIQAGLSTVTSIIAGVMLAWALNRLQFFGRDLVVGLFAAAIVTPGIVVAFGLLSIWGRNGWINQLSESLFGNEIGNLAYGLGGIVLAHTVLDGAFAARILLARLDAVPANRLKIGQSLGLSAWQRFTIIDWPAMRETIPGLAAIIFLLAFTSFPIVLLLGGGPANQTLEVAIYAAVRQSFDLVGAVNLALVQIVVCAGVIAMAAGVKPVPSALGPSAGQHWRDRASARALAWVTLVVFAVGFAAPLLAVLVDGLSTGVVEILGRPAFWAAALTSLTIGTLSALLTLVLALIIGMGRAAIGPRWMRLLVGMPAYAYLAVPAVVLSLGFFLLVRMVGFSPASAAPVVVVIANSLLALPFAIATIGPPLDAVARTRGKLIRSLGLNGWRQFFSVEYPLLGRDIGIVLALAFCFSLGDLGVIALFGSQDFETLPLMMYRALGSYRSNEAAVIAAMLLIGTIFAFVGLPRLVERLSNARS